MSGSSCRWCTPAGEIGLQTSGIARHITVFAKDTQQSNSHTGVVLNGGTLEDSIVDVGMKLSAGANLADGPAPSTVRDSVVTASTPVASSYGGLIERSRLIGGALGLQAWRNLTTVRSSTIETQLPHARGVYEYTSPGYDTNVVLDGVDVIGPGGADTRGVWTSTLAQGTKATATVRNSILRGFIASLAAEGGGKVDASYSDYDGSGNLNQGAKSPNPASRTSARRALPPRAITTWRRARRWSTPAIRLLSRASTSPATRSSRTETAMAPRGATSEPTSCPARPSCPRTVAVRARTRGPRSCPGFASTRRSFAKRTRFRFTLSETARVTIRIRARPARAPGALPHGRRDQAVRQVRPEQHRVLAQGRPPAAARGAVPRGRTRRRRRRQPVGIQARDVPHRRLEGRGHRNRGARGKIT